MVSDSADSMSRRVERLWAALAALCATFLLLACLDQDAQRLIRASATAFAPLNLPEAGRGVGLQREILRRPEFLPVYGSSELEIRESTRPALFFQQHPCGFAVFPVGSAGDRCLVILQELAAMSDVVRGKRIAIFLSPTWFTPPAQPKSHPLHLQFASRFSPLEAGILTFGSALSPGLKREIARRLLDFGSVLRERSPLLATTMAHLQEDTWMRPGWVALLHPLGVVDNLVLSLQDRWRLRTLIRSRPAVAQAPAVPASKPTPIDWSALIQTTEAAASEHGRSADQGSESTVYDAAGDRAANAANPARPEGADADFLRRMNHATEWTDFALLLRTVKELRAEVLILDQPINGRLSDLNGVSAAARQTYYDRVRRTAAAYGVDAADFSSHEEDPGFFCDEVHPSAKAWIYYNQSLDAFYHRPAR